MMQTIDIRALTPSRSELARLVPRAGTDVAAATETAAGLIDDVRTRGVAALLVPNQPARAFGTRITRIRTDFHG